MIILGIVLLIIGSLTKIAIVGMTGIVALVVGLVLILSARSATRWVAAAITGDGARLGDRRHAVPARKRHGNPRWTRR